jgi:hydroxymethylpyrimidine pyrophosphatase-like HAD family hydrolase
VTSTPPRFGLLLDVDGPIASPVSRSIAIPSIARDLAALANAGIPVIFNTGRSDAFIAGEVVEPLLAAGLERHVRVFAICEKGATWFEITPDGAGEVSIDSSLTPPVGFDDDVRALVAENYADLVFYDETKRATVTFEQRLDVSKESFLARQLEIDEAAIALLNARGYGARRGEVDYPDASGAVQYRADPSIISTDFESLRVGKDFGAERAFALLEGTGEMPLEWRTMGDSRGDYAMATWLHERGETVAHVDVRPADGIPQTAYPVLTAGDLIHDEAGALFLTRWLAMLDDDSLDDSALGR